MARHTLSYIQEIGSGWFGKVQVLLFTVLTGSVGGVGGVGVV